MRVKATDPSGASETQDVVITIKDVNESPEFDTETTGPTLWSDQLTLYVDENRTSGTTLTALALRTVLRPSTLTMPRPMRLP